MTATAWYHKKLDDNLQNKSLLDVIDISEDFAYEKLLPALARAVSYTHLTLPTSDLV